MGVEQRGAGRWRHEVQHTDRRLEDSTQWVSPLGRGVPPCAGGRSPWVVRGVCWRPAGRDTKKIDAHIFLARTAAWTPQPQCCWLELPILSEVPHQPESRMREIRKYGSEGGGAGGRSPSPYQSVTANGSPGRKPAERLPDP